MLVCIYIGVQYSVKCGPKQFKAYLEDMGSLILDVIDNSNKTQKVIAQGNISNLHTLLDKVNYTFLLTTKHILLYY